MGNREHQKLLEKHPFLTHSCRGWHMDGPPVWMKRQWQHQLRARIRQLLRQDPDSTTYPTRAGNPDDWY